MGIEELKKQEATRNASDQKEKSWFQKWWGIGLIVIVSVNVIGVFISPAGIGSSGLSPCDCLEAMVTSNEVYRKCLLQDIDKAFDYWESRDPSRKFQNSEAVIQAYWMEKSYQ